MISVPLFHATGCHAILCGSTFAGSKLVFMHKWDPEVAMELIEKEKITSFGGVPSMVWQVLEEVSLLSDLSINSAQSPYQRLYWSFLSQHLHQLRYASLD